MEPRTALPEHQTHDIVGSLKKQNRRLEGLLNDLARKMELCASGYQMEIHKFTVEVEALRTAMTRKDIQIAALSDEIGQIREDRRAQNYDPQPVLVPRAPDRMPAVLVGLALVGFVAIVFVPVALIVWG